MKSRESWYVKSIRFFYGIRDNIDEYRMQEINRIGNNSFMMLTIYVFLMSELLILLPKFIGFKNVTLIISLLNLIALLLIFIYDGQSMKKLHLTQIDAYDEKDYKIWMKKTKWRAIGLTILFLFFQRINNIGIEMERGKSFVQALFYLKDGLMDFVPAIVFGVVSYYTMKKKIKK